MKRKTSKILTDIQKENKQRNERMWAIIKSYIDNDDLFTELSALESDFESAIDDFSNDYYRMEGDNEANEREIDSLKEDIEDLQRPDNAFIIEPQSLKQYMELEDYLTNIQFPYLNSTGLQIPIF